MNLKAQHKILIGIGAPIVLLVFLGIFILNSLNSIIETENQVLHTHEVLESSSNLLKSMVDMETGVRGFMVSGQDVFLEPFYSGKKESLQGITALQQLVSDNPPQVDKLDQVWTAVDQWMTKVAEPGIALRRGLNLETSLNNQEILENAERGKEIFDQIRIYMNEFDTVEHRLMDERVAMNLQTHGSAYQTVIFTFVATIFIGLILAYVIGQNISKPLVQATNVMRRFASGERKIRIPENNRSDEIGVLMMAFNNLADELEQVTNYLFEENEIRREAEQKANIANQAKSDFLSTMSHEIRTPLSGILGMTQLLLKTELTKEQSYNINTILNSGNSLLTLINDTLDISKIEAGNIEIEELTFDCQDAVLSIARAYEYLCNEAGLDFELNIDMAGQTIFRGDQNRLQQILRNLLGNALKFTPRGKVLLSAEKLSNDDPENISGADYTVRINVTDTGKGIAADRMDAIFESFSQEDSSITREYGGTGLGLFIAKKFAEMMGGRISVTSEVGKGSNFELLIPFGEASQLDIQQLIKEKQFVLDTHFDTSLNILVAEDNEVNQLIVNGYLDSMGHTVTMVENGQEAVDAIKSGEKFDLVLMDIHMPVMNGVNATLEIRKLEHGRNVPIVALTAEVFVERIQYFLDAGINDVLTKPFTERQLVKILRGVSEQGKNINNHNKVIEPLELENLEEFPIGNAEGLEVLRNKVSPEKIDKLVNSVQENLKKSLEELKEGVNSADSSLIKLSSHKIMGSTGSFYAVRLSKIAAAIQMKSDDIEEVRKLMPMIEEAANETIQWWQSL